MTNAEIRELGLSQHWLLWVVALSFVGLLTSMWVVLLAFPFQVYVVWRMSRTMELPPVRTFVYLVLMVVPIISIIGLVSLNHKASLRLRAAGIKVGPFGVALSDLPRSTQAP